MKLILALLIAACAWGQNPNTAAFPTTVATDQDLPAAKTRSSSTLSTSINASTLTVVVGSGASFIQYQIISIDTEEMLICSISSNTLTICSGTRGLGDTTAASHTAGAAVRGVISSYFTNQLAAESKAIEARLRDRAAQCVDAGSTDAYACSPAPSLGSYSTGQRVSFKANTANTGAATFAANGLSALAIKKLQGGITTDLATNDIRANQWVEVVYDGTNWQMMSALGNATDLSTYLLSATHQAGTPLYCRSTSGNDTYVCSVTPALTAYTRGGCLVLDGDTANTGAATVNVNGLGAKSILNRAVGALSNNDITANAPITICYDGTQYIIQGDGGGTGGSSTLTVCAAASGSTTVYTCAGSPTLGSYAAGTVAVFIPDLTNTGTSSINIDTLGAKIMYKVTMSGYTALVANDLVAGFPYFIVYDGTVFNLIGAAPYNQFINDEGSGLAQRSVVNFIGSGVTCVDNSGTGKTDCTITGGGAASVSDLTDLKVSASSADLTIAAGSYRCGSTVYALASPITITLSSGTADADIIVDCLNAGTSNAFVISTTNTVTGTGFLSTTAAYTTFANREYIAHVTVSGANWNAVTNKRTINGGGGIVGYTGITVDSDSNGLPRVAVDGTVRRGSIFSLETVGCAGTTGTLMWDTLASLAPTATCSAGSTESNLMRGVADFPDSDGEYSIQRSFVLPSTWQGGMSAKFKWRAAATSGDVIWHLATVCRADGEVDDAAFNTASTVTDTAKGTTNQLNDASIGTVTVTGCAAGEWMHIKVHRQRTTSGDTITGVVSLVAVEITLI